MTTPFIVLFRVQYSELHTGRFLAYPVLLHPSRPIGPLYSVPLQFPRLVLLRCRCKLRKERKMITQSAKTRYPLNFLHQHTIPPHNMYLLFGPQIALCFVERRCLLSICLSDPAGIEDARCMQLAWNIDCQPNQRILLFNLRLNCFHFFFFIFSLFPFFVRSGQA